jgi:hypothetical protein
VLRLCNPRDGFLGVTTTSCSTCSVSGTEIGGDGYVEMATDGQSAFLVTETSGNETVIRVAADGTISTLASNRRNMSPLAVGPNALAWWEDGSPDPTHASPVYALPTNTAGTPLALATIDPGTIVVDGANLYYVGSGTTTLNSIPLVGAALRPAAARG